MIYERFINEYLKKGLIKNQPSSLITVKKLLKRAAKELIAAEANLKIDEGIAFTVAYTAMLHAARAIMLLKGYIPDDGAQHKTAIEFSGCVLGKEAEGLVQYFEMMRRKRNNFIYEAEIAISVTEAQNAIEAAKKFVFSVNREIKKIDPQIEINLGE